MTKILLPILIICSLLKFSPARSQTQPDSIIVTTETGTVRYTYPYAYVTADAGDSIITRNTATKKRGLLPVASLPVSTAQAQRISDTANAIRQTVNAKATITTTDSMRTNIYNAINTKAALTGALFSGAFGYASGAGGTVTQSTNKSTGVTLNKLTGEITLNNAALASATIVSFTLINSTITATDVIILNHVTTGTRGAYTLNAQCANGSAVIYIRNNTAGSLGEAIVIRYVVVRGAVN